MTREEIEARLEAIPIPETVESHTRYFNVEICGWGVERTDEDRFTLSQSPMFFDGLCRVRFMLARSLTMSEAARLIEAFQ